MEVRGIVVVDDDNDIRKLIADFLGGEDYDNYEIVIAVFEDGEIAWQFMEECGSIVDLLITDLEMPKMDGRTLLEKVKGEYPEIKVIMMSGKKAAERIAKEAGADRFLKKPFKLEQLRMVVQELLPQALFTFL